MGSSVMKQFKFFDFHVPVVQLFFVLRKSCKKTSLGPPRPGGGYFI